MRIPEPIVFRKLIPARVTMTVTPFALDICIVLAGVSCLSSVWEEETGNALGVGADESSSSVPWNAGRGIEVMGLRSSCEGSWFDNVFVTDFAVCPCRHRLFETFPIIVASAGSIGV
ncbi:efflux pump protein [Pochonia chlamydosporia 170]|uniref:Efflux pump protein n=1 Tax=Pochonia chlamydosporia 170 TaxID=1380566 RepID=A0A179FWM3_METCM|nr:efflux pump protein [Pochonia chlamydosporia 170]OAQ70012.2 efflux pump protein [Pochonia chlamydosporia 170]